MLREILVCVTLILPASVYGVFEPPKDRLLSATIYVESRYETDAVKADENAVGILQIRPVMIRDVNRICKLIGDPRQYTLADRTDPDKSIEIWYLVQGYYNPEYNLRLACLVWNGRGKDGKGSKDYLEKIIHRYYFEAAIDYGYTNLVVYKNDSLRASWIYHMAHL
mgnify:CR=1 FL=1